MTDEEKYLLKKEIYHELGQILFVDKLAEDKPFEHKVREALWRLERTAEQDYLLANVD